MTAYAAFLRAINVGGRRVTNDQLRAAFETLDLSGVRTLLASGNVVFTSPRRSPGPLEVDIGAALADRFGFAVRTFVRSRAQLETCLGAAPFGPVPDGSTVHITFLERAPEPAVVTAIEAASLPGDELRVVGSELHWLRAGRMTDTALDWKAIDRGPAATLGETTTRTAATVAKALALMRADRA